MQGRGLSRTINYTSSEVCSQCDPGWLQDIDLFEGRTQTDCVTTYNGKFEKALVSSRSRLGHVSRCLPDGVLHESLTPATVSDFKLGYPNLATFKNSSDSFAIYRRFGYLQSRLLLEKQDILRVLEHRLDQYDQGHVTTSYTRTLSADKLMPRQALLEEIEHAFNSYGES
jgi:hypothetical protein